MAASLGKKFEDVFRATWKAQLPNSFIYRLPDQQTGFSGRGGSNPCDFIGFSSKKLLLVECKEHKGASLPFAAIRQIDDLISFIGYEDVYPGVLLWLSEKDRVLWIPATTLQKMKADGKKSVGIKAIEEHEYNIVDLPAKKKRVFMEANLAYLVDHAAGNSL